MNSLGERLRSVRGETSGPKFAQYFDEKATNIYRYENNQRRPKPEFLERVAKMFGVSVEWLLFGDEPQIEGATDAVCKTFEPEIKLMERKQGKMHRYTDMEEILKRIESKLEASEEERREVSAENRQLHNEVRQLLRENGELKAEVASLKAQLAAGARGGTTKAESSREIQSGIRSA